jgi:AcrR family transcriptional regulator
MVQKDEKRPRGRPRTYDPDDALAKAMGAFWDRGYAATSLDDISAATGMNRPSLYAAFGDKQTIYLKAIEHYRAGPAVKNALAGGRTLREALRRVYKAALAIYLDGDLGARGCFVIGTAATEAVTNPPGASSSQACWAMSTMRSRRASGRQGEGELPADADPGACSSLRDPPQPCAPRPSRREAPRARAIAEAGVASVCG